MILRMRFPLVIAAFGGITLLILWWTGKQDTELRIGIVDPKTEVESRHLTFEHDGHQFIRPRTSSQYFIHHPSCKLCAQKELK